MTTEKLADPRRTSTRHRFWDGIRFVILAEILLWSRRQAMDIGLRSLLVLIFAVVTVGFALLPTLGATVGYLSVSVGVHPNVVAGWVLVAATAHSLTRVLGALPASRRTTVQQPADLEAYRALGNHPNSILAARADTPAAAAALLSLLLGTGTMGGASLVDGVVGPHLWLAGIVVPISAAVTESRLLRRPPGRIGDPSWPIAILAFITGWGIGSLAAGTRLSMLRMLALDDHAVLVALAAIGRWASTAAPAFTAVAGVVAAGSILWPVASRADDREHRPIVSPPLRMRHILNLTMQRSELPAIITHRRLSRAALTAGWVVLGTAASSIPGSGFSSDSLAVTLVGLLAMAAMMLAVSQSSGLGLPAMQESLRWLHDAGISAPRVALNHQAQESAQILLTMLPAIVGVAVLTRSPAVLVAGTAVTLGAAAAASLGDLADTTRTVHADGTRETGIVGGLLTAAIQALLASPWGGLLTDTPPPFIMTVGVAGTLAVHAITTIFTVRRIHP